jgi:hypothetical protein
MSFLEERRQRYVIRVAEALRCAHGPLLFLQSQVLIPTSSQSTR